jgi:hypothetical protein
MGCADVPCQTSALDADTTPSTTLTLTASGMSDTLDLDCGSCFNLMNNSCISESCPTEWNAYLQCNAMMGMGCDTELNACFSRNMATIQSCARPRIESCFG